VCNTQFKVSSFRNKSITINFIGFSRMQAQCKVRVMKAETEYSKLYSRMLKNIAKISFSAFKMEFYVFMFRRIYPTYSFHFKQN